MKPLVTIVIPIYNVEPYISDCLQSVMRQTYKGPLECILVDDCGTDKSIEIAQNMIAEYNGPIEFKVLHHEHNRGVSAARNTGIDAAKGDYVCFLDGDDWISDDCIEKLVQPLQNEVFDIVIGDYELVGYAPYHLVLSLPEGSYHEKGVSKVFCNEGVYVMPWNKLYSKEFLNRNRLRFEEGKKAEDEIFAFDISCFEKSYYVVKSVTYYYRMREGSDIHNNDTTTKLTRYADVLKVVKGKVEQRYKDIEGIFDFYMFWVIRVFSWTFGLEMEEEMKAFFENRTKGYLEPIPDVRCLKNKHYRLLYFACKRDQTYSRFLYVYDVYSEKLKGRVLRNVLNLLPYKRIVI